jgi:two-component system, NtrC family, sensor kinase
MTADAEHVHLPFHQQSAVMLLIDPDRDLMFRMNQDGCLYDVHSLALEQRSDSPRSFIGKNITELLPEKAVRTIMGGVAEASETGRHQGTIYSMILSREVRWFELSVAAMEEFPGTGRQFIVLSRDITERRRNEEALREQSELVLQQEQRLSDVIYGAHIGTWEWHVPTGVMVVNDRWAEILGYSLEELEPVGRRMWQSSIHAVDFLRSVEIFEKHVKGEADFYECECRMRHKTGIWIWTLERGKIISRNTDGTPLVMSGTCMDITLRKEAENRVVIQQQQLEAMNAHLTELVQQEIEKNQAKDLMLMQQEKLAAIGKLAAGVAHEINTPIGFISSNLSVLTGYFAKFVNYDRQILAQGDSLPSPERERIIKSRKEQKIEYIVADGVDLIKESLDGADKIAKIVRDLKWFSRVDTPEQELVELSSCLESALEICGNELSYVATITKEYQPVPPVLCNTGQMNQLFLNLLLNASQAIVPPGEILLRCWHDAVSVYVSVSDTGGGILPENLERIFDPFFTTKEVGQGTGLGLSVSKEIVKLHHGEILVESMVGRGTIFTVVLPLP